MKKIIGAVVVLGLVLLLKFVIGPMIIVEGESALGQGWDDAKSELTQQFQVSMTEAMAEFKLDQATLGKISTCCADKSVGFLNTTDCKYKYNEATTTEAEHLQAQEECMVNVGYEQKEVAFVVDCLKSHFPDDWKHAVTLLEGGFTISLVETGVEEARAKTMATCMADKAATLFNARKCPFKNMESADMDNLFNGVESCIKDAENDKEYIALINGCNPEATQKDTAATEG